MRDELLVQRPDWATLPNELDEAWEWMEGEGYGSDSESGYLLLPYPGDDVLGPIFMSKVSLEGWFEEETPGHDALLPIAQVAGDGSFAALWREEDEQVRVVLLTSDGSGCVVAESALDFLKLVAIGYDELQPFFLGVPPAEEESVDALSGFRAWVEEKYHVSVPESWPSVGDDRFSAWLDASLCVEDDSQAVDSDTVGGDAVAYADFTGDVALLLPLLGTQDGPELVARFSAIVGVELKDSLSKSAKQLDKVGIETERDRHGLDTVWIELASYPRPQSLINGLDETATMSEVLNLLGEPAEQGGQWLLYKVAGRVCHLEFEGGSLSMITLMARPVV